MKKITTILLAGTAAIFMNACGGGGSSDPVDPVEPNTNQYDLRTFINTKGYVIDGEGTITVPTGKLNLTGTLQSIYQGVSMAPTGETVHNHDVTIILTADTISVTQSADSTTYEGYIVYVDRITDGVVCETPLALSSLTPVPIDAQVGYISDTIPLECSDGSYVTTVLKLNDAGGGNAELSVISNTYVSQGGVLESSETDNIILSPTMSILSANISGSIPADGITFNLDSTSIAQTQN